MLRTYTLQVVQSGGNTAKNNPGVIKKHSLEEFDLIGESHLAFRDEILKKKNQTSDFFLES